MVDRNLIHNLDAASSLADWEDELNQALEDRDLDGGKEWHTPEDFGSNRIVEGIIVRIDNEFVLVDIGARSEGAIKRDEWGEDEEAPQVGQKVKALIEEDEDSEKPQENRDMLLLSKRKAEKIEAWENVIKQVHVGDVVEGIVSRKIRGGLLVDVGVNVFLPADQVDIHRTNNITDFIGKSVQCIVQRIDETRRIIYVSRRALIEVEREEQKRRFLSELQEDQSSPASSNSSTVSPRLGIAPQTSTLLLLIQDWPFIVHNGWIIYRDEEENSVFMIRKNGTDKTNISKVFKNTPAVFNTVVENGPDWIIKFEDGVGRKHVAVIHMS